MAIFWTTQTTNDLIEYKHNQTESNYNKLRTPIFNIIIRVLTKFNYEVNDDNTIELESVIYNAIQTVQIDKADYALNYLYLAARNHLNHRTKINKKYENELNESNYYINEQQRITDNNITTSIEYKEEQHYKRNRIIKELNKRIDERIEEQKQNSKRTTPTKQIAFLLLLRNYLIDNDFEYAGFEPYAIKALGVTRKRYMIIANKCGIKSNYISEAITVPDDNNE